MKKVNFMLIAVILTIFMCVPASAAEKTSTALTDAGIITYEEASKDLGEVVTRGEFVTLLNRLFHIYTTTGDTFSDVSSDSPYYHDMMAAKRQGYIQGYDDGGAYPEEPVLRMQAASAFSRLISLPQATDASVFSDNDSIPVWAQDGAQRVVACGIMTVSEDGAFDSTGYYTRGELYSALEAVIELGLQNRVDEYYSIKSFDGYELTGRLSAPSGNDKIEKLVIFVDGTGPDTYEMNRQNDAAGLRFKYLDVHADNFTAKGIAFFTSNTRGVDIGDEPPYYATIDDEGYQTYTPQNVAKDINYILKELRQNPRLADAKVFLLGWSEGAIIAPLSVAEYGAEVDALLLAGYPNENMKEILEYQLGGGMSFFNYCQMFNVTDSDQITKEQFETDPNQYLDSALQGVQFEHLDVDGDGVLTEKDFKIMMQPTKDGLFTAVEENDDEWIAENMSAIMPPLCTVWFQEHFKLGKTEDIMVKVDIPIYIFQGTADPNCPVQGTYDVQKRFEKIGKTNLTANIYEGYDHDLNYALMLYGMESKGINDILKTVIEFE